MHGKSEATYLWNIWLLKICFIKAVVISWMWHSVVRTYVLTYESRPSFILKICSYRWRLFWCTSLQKWYLVMVVYQYYTCELLNCSQLSFSGSLPLLVPGLSVVFNFQFSQCYKVGTAIVLQSVSCVVVVLFICLFFWWCCVYWEIHWAYGL
jgi:hypothetical protein